MSFLALILLLVAAILAGLRLFMNDGRLTAGAAAALILVHVLAAHWPL